MNFETFSPFDVIVCPWCAGTKFDVTDLSGYNSAVCMKCKAGFLASFREPSRSSTLSGQQVKFVEIICGRQYSHLDDVSRWMWRICIDARDHYRQAPEWKSNPNTSRDSTFLRGRRNSIERISATIDERLTAYEVAEALEG
jgi:hypothetical protein